MHASTAASTSQSRDARPVVQAAVVPVVAVAIISVVIIVPSAGGVLG
jgi:hypothetical protein